MASTDHPHNTADTTSLPADAPYRKRVAVVYHFFAHYRGPVLDELLRNAVHNYILIGSKKGFDGIEPWHPDDDQTIEDAPMVRWHNFDIFQPKALLLPFRPSIDTIIYLGNAHWISTWISAALARLLGKRVLFWTHGWIHDERGLKGGLRRLFYRLGHGLLLYGHVAKAIGIGRDFAATKLHVIYNSLDYAAQRATRESISQERTRQIRQSLFRDELVPVAICSSRLIRLRRLDLLIEAAAILRNQGHTVNLILVGDGPERASLERLAASKSVCVAFIGACYDERRLGELTMAANVTVAPGKVGLTAMQSLGYGTPVITHDDPSDQMPEWEAIIPGKTGDLFRRGNVAHLAEVLQRWTSTPWPTQDLRNACVQIIERFYTPTFQRWAIDRAVSGHTADDLFWQRERRPERDRPAVAYISNGFTPYNVHFLKRVHSELKEIDLHCCYTHEFSMGDWKLSTGDLNVIQFGKGQWALEQGRIKQQFSEFSKAGRLIRHLEQINAAAVIMMGYNDLGRLRIVNWCRRRGIPCYIWGDSNIRGDRTSGLKAFVKRAYVGAVAKRVTGALACGRLGREYFEKYGFASNRIYLVPNEPDYSLVEGIQESLLDEVASRFGVDRSRRRIIYSGRLVQEKRVDLLIQAFARIANERPGWDLLIVGNGPLRNQLGAMVPENLRSRVIWPGFLGDQRYVSAMYRLSDVLVLPSDYEPWALVINEAACAGLAIVASDVVGAAAELVRDDVNGQVFPRGDQEALAEVLLRVTDPANIQRMRSGSAQVLGEWRAKADPVDGVRQSLQAAGVVHPERSIQECSGCL